MVNIKDIAKLTNLSVSTVSKVVNNKAEDLSQETIKKVLKVVKEYNYVPYGKIKLNSNTKSFNIAFVSKNFNKNYRLLSETIKNLRIEGYTTLILDSEESEDIEHLNLSKLNTKNIDGIIWEPVLNSSLENNSKVLTSKNYKTLIINSTKNNINSINIEYYKMAKIITQNLIDLGHKDIICIYKENTWRGNEVLEGYKRTLFNNEINNILVYPFNEDNFNPEDLNLSSFTAIMCSHFSVAEEVYNRLNSENYNIPDDFSIASIKNSHDNKFIKKHISSINVPHEQLGQYISKNIINLVEKNDYKTEKVELEYKIDSNVSIGKPKNNLNPYTLLIGSINLDNMIFLDEFPEAGKVSSSSKNLKLAGGKALNQAIGLKQLEKNVKLFGKIGTDEAANIIKNTLNNYNISTQFIKNDYSVDTSIAYIPIKKNGESSIIISDGANNSLTIDDLTSFKNIFNNVLYTIIQTEIPKDVAFEAIRLSKLNSSKTIVKPALIDKIDDNIYPLIDIFVPNFSEATTLSGLYTPEEQANYFLRKGVKEVVITLGSKGAFLKNQKIERHFPSEASIVLDETGAADAFISALCSKLIEGNDIENAIIAGNIAASYCISKFGVSGSLIDKDTLNRYLELKL